MTLVNGENNSASPEIGVSMCTTEMTEGFTMSPSTASSSGTNCIGSPGTRVMISSRSAAGRAREPHDDDEDEISVGCPSPLPLVVGATPQDDEDRLSTREEYSERLSPRSYIDDDERYSRDGEYISRRRSRTTSRCEVRETEEGDDEERSGNADDYFKPLKRLKMVPIQQSDEEDDRDREANERGVKSFSIIDILSHRPKAKIVRPWDTVESNHHHRHHPQIHHTSPHSTPRDLSLMGMSLASMSGSMSEPPLSSSSSSGRSSVSDSGSPDPLAHHHHHHHHHSMHHGLHPGLHHPAMQQHFKRKSGQQHNQGQNGKRSTGQGSPLDALFQMTSKTFDAGEHSQGEIARF